MCRVGTIYGVAGSKLKESRLRSSHKTHRSPVWETNVKNRERRSCPKADHVFAQTPRRTHIRMHGERERLKLFGEILERPKRQSRAIARGGKWKTSFPCGGAGDGGQPDRHCCWKMSIQSKPFVGFGHSWSVHQCLNMFSKKITPALTPNNRTKPRTGQSGQRHSATAPAPWLQSTYSSTLDKDPVPAPRLQSAHRHLFLNLKNPKEVRTPIIALAIWGKIAPKALSSRH